MSDAFLSYSRQDGDFVRRLAGALNERGKDVWVDVDGIRDTERFPEALRRAIESSDAFVFVISPDSVSSEFCEQEVSHAAGLNKRIVPLALRQVPDTELPEEIRFRNWIPVDGGVPFEAGVDRVVAALDTDIGWERQHTRMTVRALEWDAAGRDKSFLLRGADLAAAERWLAAGADKDPGPTLLESEYVVAARAAATRRQRNLVAVSLGVAAVSIALLVFALISRSDAIHARNDAINARDTARAQALTSDAERLGAEALSDPNVDHSLLLAVTGVELQDRLQTRSDLFADLQQHAALLRLIHASNVQINALDVSPDGRLLVVGDASGTVKFINLATWRTQGAVVRLHAPIGQRDLSLSPDGRTVMALANGTDRSELYAIDVASRRARRMLSWTGPQPGDVIDFDAVAYSPDGAEVAVTEEDWPAGHIPTASRLVMLDASTGRVRWQRRYPLRPGQADPHLVFTAAGMLLTSAQQGDTLIWDPRTGRIVRRFPLGGQPALAPDGRTVALGQNSPYSGDQSASVVLLDLRTGSHRALLENLPNNWIRSLAFTPGGSEIAGATTGGVQVWDVASGKIILSPVAQAGTHSLSVLDPHTDVLISGQQDGSVTAFDLSGARSLGRAFRWNTPEQSCGYAPCIAVNRQSSLMATNQANGTVAVVDLRTLRLVRTLPTRDGNGGAATFMPDGRRSSPAGPIGRWFLGRGQRPCHAHAAVRTAGVVGRRQPRRQAPGHQTSSATAPKPVEVVRIATARCCRATLCRTAKRGVHHDGRELWRWAAAHGLRVGWWRGMFARPAAVRAGPA